MLYFMSKVETPAEAFVEYDDSAIPKLLSINTTEFQKKYNQWATFHDEVLPPEAKQEKRGGQPGPDTYKEFLKMYGESSEMHQHLVNELTTMLREYEKEDDTVNGDPIWRHQKALVIECIQMLVQKRYNNAELTSFLMEEAPGSGKTRIMGIIIAALSRMMVRGVLDGNVLVLVRRKAIVMQQTLTKDAMRKTMLSTEFSKMRNREVREQSTFVDQEFRGSGFEFFPEKVWMEICKAEPESVAAAEKLIEQSLRDREGLWDEFVRFPHHKRVMNQLACCASRQGGVVLAANAIDLEFIELSPPSETENGEGKGDLLFGVPNEMFQKGSVFIQSGFNTIGGADGSVPSANTRIAVMSLPSTYQHAVRVKMAPFLRNLMFGFLDEGGKLHPSELASIGSHPDIGAQKDAHVFAATAYRDPKRSQYDGHFSHFTVEDAINSPDKVLQSPRMHVFPGDESVRFPSGSYEAAEQLIKKFGENIALPTATDTPQAIEDGSQLVVVHNDLVPYVVMRLRQEYGDTGIRFIAYNPNSKTEEHTGRIQLRMNDPVYTQTCLVGSMDRVVDSFDWRKLRATFMGVKESASTMEFMKRLFGRQFHSMLENGFIVQQLFEDHSLRNRLPWLAYLNDAGIEAAGPITLHPGQHFIGRDDCAVESKQIAGLHLKPQQTWSASTKNEFETHTRRENAHVTTPKTSDHLLTEQSFVLQFPQIPKNVSRNQHGVGKAYIREFATLNKIEQFIDEFDTALRTAGKGDDVRSAILQEVALECTLKEVLQISHNAKGNIKKAEEDNNKQKFTRTNWEKSVAAESGRANIARAKVSKVKKPRVAPPQPKGNKYADRVIRQVEFADGADADDPFDDDDDELEHEYGNDYDSPYDDDDF